MDLWVFIDKRMKNIIFLKEEKNLSGIFAIITLFCFNLIYIYLGFLGEIYFYLGDAWKDCVIQGPPAPSLQHD